MHEIEHLYHQVYRKKVKSMTYLLHGDFAAAEDVVQEAFARAFQYYPTYNPERSSIETWFNSILFNSFRDYQREAKGDPISHVKDVSVEEVLEDMVIDDPCIRKGISNMANETHKQVLELFFLLGYTSTEISKIVRGMSVTNVTTIVKRFRDGLKGEQ